MNNRPLVIAIVIVLFFLITGTLLWSGGILQSLKKPRGNTAVIGDLPKGNDGSGDQIENEVVEEVTLLPPPAGFKTLNQNNPELSPELKNELLQAFEDFIRRLEAVPDAASTWADLGSVKYAFMDYRGAEELWRYTLALNPNILVAYANLGELYWHKLSDYPKAEEAFLQIIERDSANAPRFYKNLSDLYRYDYKEKRDFADDVLLDALKQYPEHQALLSHLAWLYMEQGELQLAIEYFERVLAVDPQNESAQEELDRLKQKVY